MIWRATMLLVLAGASTVAVGETFSEAMGRARQSEAALDPGQMVGLVDAHRAAMQLALTRCTPRRSTIPDSFAVVLRLEEGGEVAATWTRSESGFEQCFAATMRDVFRYVPPRMPFYTSIDFRRSRSRE